MALWTLDKAHTTANFSARHMMVATVHGRFAAPTGTINFDPANPTAASVEATIDATTLTTDLADRDGHLKSPDFLDVAKYPSITFKSTKVEPQGQDTAKVTGDLTIRGVTRPIVLDVEFLGTAKDPWGGHRAGFSATARINREDFGLTWNVALEAGGVLVGKDIKLTLEAEAILVPESEAAAAGN
ncbi:MAG: YceI family protein [Chloroflexi bacterium]|nr:YceI family protein [Chloroflexota bacterium]